MSEKPVVRLVAIDDDAAVLELVATILQDDEIEVFCATDPEAGLDLVARKRPQIVILDLQMPRMSGMEVLERILASNPSTDVLLMTGHYSSESAVEAIQKGACDYLNKPVSTDRLRARIGKLAEDARRVQSALELDHALVEAYRFEGMIGRSPQMLEVYTRVRRIAPHFRTALVTGATGTGKELVAKSLHQLNPAALGPFVVCNCSAIVETLIESELFGHVKGAFTGATRDKAGVFEYAHRGTVFLDEIGEMPLAAQAKLLRVLQDHEVQRVGSPAVRPVDVRVVAATHRNLTAMVAQGAFREDLFYRLSMVEIKVPSLSERSEDIPLLERHFLEQFAARYGKPVATLTRRARAVLARHSWPGNVRELENVIGHACMMAQGSTIDLNDLPEHFAHPDGATIARDEEFVPLQEAERRYALRVLERAKGNKAQAAEILQISRATLYRLLADQKDAGSRASV
jgi:DNA-binding NtrC family response regulator